MKVLIVRTFPDVLNLNTYNVQEVGLAKALAYKGITCGVVLYNGRNANKKEQITFERDGLKFSYTIYWLKGFAFYKNGFMPSVYRLIQEYDVIQVHEYDQIMSWMLYSKPRKPTLVYHGPYYHPYAKGYNFKCRIFDQLFLRRRKYGNVLALAKSELAAGFLIKKGFCHVHAVGVGLDGDKFKMNEGEKINSLLLQNRSRFRLLYVGKIEERRNVYFLIQLFEKMLDKYDNLDLVIVGDGEAGYVSAFLSRIQKWLENGRIIYFSKATQRELSLLYRNVDLFLFTSNYEIFGMVLLEAMYFGLPVVSSANGGASMLIQNGINGYMIDGFNLSEWKMKLYSVIESKQLWEQMSKAAYRTIADHFLWDRLADRFIEGYQEAMVLFTTKK